MCARRGNSPAPSRQRGMLYEKQLQPFLEDFGSEPLCHILRRDHIKNYFY